MKYTAEILYLTRVILCSKCKKYFLKEDPSKVFGIKHYCSYECGAEDQPKFTIGTTNQETTPLNKI